MFLANTNFGSSNNAIRLDDDSGESAGSTPKPPTVLGFDACPEPFHSAFPKKLCPLSYKYPTIELLQIRGPLDYDKQGLLGEVTETSNLFPLPAR